MSEEEKPVTLVIGTKWHHETIYTSILLLQITHSPQSLVPYGTKSQVSTGSIELDFLQDLFAAARYIDQLLPLGDGKTLNVQRVYRTIYTKLCIQIFHSKMPDQRTLTKFAGKIPTLSSILPSHQSNCLSVLVIILIT